MTRGRRLRLAALVALALFAAAVVGVNYALTPAPLPVLRYVEVEGVVTQAGQPLDEVEVSFLPDPEAGTLGPVASGFTDAAGKYLLRTDKYEQVGVIVGKHRVLVRDIRAFPAPGGGLAPEGKPPPPSRVPAAYESVHRTPLRTEVRPETKFHDIAVPPRPAPPGPPDGKVP